MAQTVKGLPHKHENLSSVPRHSCKTAGYGSVCLYLNTGEVKTRGLLEFTSQPACLAELEGIRSMRGHV